jgi:hypothetical protein
MQGNEAEIELHFLNSGDLLRDYTIIVGRLEQARNMQRFGLKALSISIEISTKVWLHGNPS